MKRHVCIFAFLIASAALFLGLMQLMKTDPGTLLRESDFITFDDTLYAPEELPDFFQAHLSRFFVHPAAAQKTVVVIDNIMSVCRALHIDLRGGGSALGRQLQRVDGIFIAKIAPAPVRDDLRAADGREMIVEVLRVKQVINERTNRVGDFSENTYHFPMFSILKLL